jgi:hypothetical protein
MPVVLVRSARRGQIDEIEQAFEGHRRIGLYERSVNRGKEPTGREQRQALQVHLMIIAKWFRGGPTLASDQHPRAVLA